MLARLRDGGIRKGLRFARQLLILALTNPREAEDHVRTQLALSRDTLPPAPVQVERDWRQALHVLLRHDSPCDAAREFDALWQELVTELQGDASVGLGHDGDPVLLEATWCVVRHAKPEAVVETGVSRGITSRVILEALARNGTGRLWSVDLPPLEDPWRALVGTAVPPRLRREWTYLRGASRRRLPPLIRRLGQVDFFIHDSLHSEDNLRFELATVWPALRPGGIVLIDDAETCRAFEQVVPELRPARAFAVRHEAKADAIGILQKGSSSRE